MKKNISWTPLGPFKSALMLAFVFGFLAVASMAAPVSAPLWIALSVLILALILLKSPLSLRLESHALSLRTPLRKKSFPIDDIRDIESLGSRDDLAPLWGMNGICGYTGYVSLDGITGKCICYYGDYRECFLLTMKSGRRYILGCDGHQEMVEAVRALVAAHSTKRQKI